MWMRLAHTAYEDSFFFLFSLFFSFTGWWLYNDFVILKHSFSPSPNRFSVSFPSRLLKSSARREPLLWPPGYLFFCIFRLFGRFLVCWWLVFMATPTFVSFWNVVFSSSKMFFFVYCSSHSLPSFAIVKYTSVGRHTQNHLNFWRVNTSISLGCVFFFFLFFHFFFFLAVAFTTQVLLLFFFYIYFYDATCGVVTIPLSLLSPSIPPHNLLTRDCGPYLAQQPSTTHFVPFVVLFVFPFWFVPPHTVLTIPTVHSPL